MKSHMHKFDECCLFLVDKKLFRDCVLEILLFSIATCSQLIIETWCNSSKVFIAFVDC